MKRSIHNHYKKCDKIIRENFLVNDKIKFPEKLNIKNVNFFNKCHVVNKSKLIDIWSIDARGYE